MVFQYSLGIDIGGDYAAFVLLKGSAQKHKVVDQVRFSLSRDNSPAERLAMIGELAGDYLRDKKIGSPPIYLSVPADLTVIRDIVFPLAVKENLTTTLKYEMEKYIPIPVANLYYDHCILSEDKARNQLTVLLVVAKKDSLAPYLQFPESFQQGFSGLETQATAFINGVKTHAAASPASAAECMELLRDQPKREAYPTESLPPALSSADFIPAYGLALKGLGRAWLDINLLPPNMRKRPSKIGFYAMLFLLAALVLSGALLIGSQAYLNNRFNLELDRQIATLANDAARYNQLLETMENLEQRIDYLNHLQTNDPAVIEILRELTQILPDGAYIKDFSYSQDTLRITGEADSANDLIRLLEGSTLFVDARPITPTRKEKSGKDSFSIEAKIRRF